MTRGGVCGQLARITAGRPAVCRFEPWSVCLEAEWLLWLIHVINHIVCCLFVYCRLHPHPLDPFRSPQLSGKRRGLFPEGRVSHAHGPLLI